MQKRKEMHFQIVKGIVCPVLSSIFDIDLKIRYF